MKNEIEVYLYFCILAKKVIDYCYISQWTTQIRINKP